MSVSLVQSSVAAAVAAMRAGEWATAITELLAAKTLLAVVPDSQKGSLSMRWRPQELDKLIAECRRNQATAARGTGGISRTPIEYEAG